MNDVQRETVRERDEPEKAVQMNFNEQVHKYVFDSQPNTQVYVMIGLHPLACLSVVKN